jgi:hypothetical protein
MQNNRPGNKIRPVANEESEKTFWDPHETTAKA